MELPKVPFPIPNWAHHILNCDVVPGQSDSTKSRLPSPLKSATPITAAARLPGTAVNVPFPLPKNTCPVPLTPTIRSALPSLLKSSVTIPNAFPAVAVKVAPWKVPSPLPSKIPIPAELETAASSLPSLLKSATTTPFVPEPER